jgi:predicted ABC-type ATPase
MRHGGERRAQADGPTRRVTPLLAILGGINSAGKSSLARRLAMVPVTAHLIFLDPDKIAAEIRHERPDRSLNAANFFAWRVVSERSADMLARGQSFVTATVLASVAHRQLCEKA